MNPSNRYTGRPPKATWNDRPPGTARRGFSIIELVGVLAIVAILAAAMVPAIMRQTDQAALTKEISDLSVIASALQSHILRSKSIPDQTAWAAAVSDDVAMPIYSITNTPRRYGRVFLIDPALRLNGAGLPFTQRTNGTARPVGARVMILASLTRPLPVASGVPSASDFNAIWNTPRGVKPGTSAFTSWAGSGRDLLIQRVNLEPLFHHVILNRSDLGGNGFYSIDGTNTVGLPANAYYVEGTVLGLYDTNSILVARELIQNDLSHAFEAGVWRDQSWAGLRTNSMSSDPPPGSGPIDPVTASVFAGTGPPSNLKWGGTPQGTVALMSSFMIGYSMWAAQNPCFGYDGNGNPNAARFPPYVLINETLGSFSKGGDIVP